MAAAGQMADPRAMEMIGEYIEHLRQAGESPEQTMRDRRGILTRLDRAMPYGLGQVSTEDLAAWLYRDEWSRNTRATYWRCLRSFYTWAADPADPWITANPTDGMTPVRTDDSVSRACSDDEVRAVVTGADEPFRTWARLAAYQALRCVDISRSNREDITRETYIVRTKGGRLLARDTDPEIWAAIRDLPKGPIARHPSTGQRATAQYISIYSRDHFHRDLKVMISMHQLRHWCGTTVQREFKDIRVTQRLLGHKSVSSTQIYTDVNDDQLRAARATLPRFA